MKNGVGNTRPISVEVDLGNQAVLVDSSKIRIKRKLDSAGAAVLVQFEHYVAVGEMSLGEVTKIINIYEWLGQDYYKFLIRSIEEVKREIAAHSAGAKTS